MISKWGHHIKWESLIPVGLALLTLILRLQKIDELSITQDESSMIRYAQEGILEKGYSFRWRGGEEFLLSTYELVPYPIALSLFFLGFSEFAVRLPAVIFSVGTDLLIYYFASYLFDRRVGLLSALLFAILPWAIYWGNNGFYPSQLQFFSLLTTVLIHRLFFEKKVPTVECYWISASFLATFFSWEVSGILLPVYLIIGGIMRTETANWLTNMHAWFAARIIIVAVIIQLTFRTVLRSPYEKLGSSLGDISFLNLAFTRTDFSPFFYIRAFIQSDSHSIMVLFFIGGLFFFKVNHNMRFLYFLVLGCQVFLTVFLGLYALRYSYFLLPYVLMISAASTFLLSDWFVRTLTLKSSGVIQVIRWLNILLLSVLQLVVAAPKGLQGNRLFSDGREAALEFRYHHRGASFRTIAMALKNHYQPGDIIIVQAPSPLIVYTQITGDYFLQSIASSAVFFSGTDSPYYMDKWVGNPVLRHYDELQDLLYQSTRVWFVSVPHFRSMKRLEPALQVFITQKMQLVEEGINGQLYLWENRFVVDGT